MKVTWIGHSCFRIEKDGYSLVIDPYRDESVPGLDHVKEEANEVLCSHEHGDHNNREGVQILEKRTSPFAVSRIETFHDEVGGEKRGENTIFLITDGSCRIAHLGDLGCELRSEQLSQLRGLDAVLIPVGGYYTIDGKQAAELIKTIRPRIVIPMHYRSEEEEFGFAEIGVVESFTRYCDSVMGITDSEIEVEEEFPEQIVVMQAKNRHKKRS